MYGMSSKRGAIEKFIQKYGRKTLREETREIEAEIVI
jgi:hypothetical protein